MKKKDLEIFKSGVVRQVIVLLDVTNILKKETKVMKKLIIVLLCLGMLALGVTAFAADYSKNYIRVNGQYINKEGHTMDFQWVSKKMFVRGRWNGNQVLIPIDKIKKITNNGRFKTTLTAAHYNLTIVNTANKVFELTEAYVYSHKEGTGDYSLKFIYYNDITMDDRIFNLHRGMFNECDKIILEPHYKVQG